MAQIKAIEITFYEWIIDNPAPPFDPNENFGFQGNNGRPRKEMHGGFEYFEVGNTFLNIFFPNGEVVAYHLPGVKEFKTYTLEDDEAEQEEDNIPF